jgi:hypothetical protein
MMPLIRERDTAEATALLDQVQERGSIPLPQLTDVDLCVFSESFFSVMEADVWDRWMGLPEQDRIALAQRTLSFLEYRKLLRRAEPDSPDAELSFRIQPKLGYILGARKQPQFTGICSVPGQLRVGDLRLFGFFDQVHADAFVLLERSTARGLGTFGRIREYVLGTVDAAAGLSADWIRASFETDQEAGDKPRMLEIYWTPEGQQLHGERFSVRKYRDEFALTHTQGTAPVFADRPITRHDLAAYIAPRLRAAR